MSKNKMSRSAVVRAELTAEIEKLEARNRELEIELLVFQRPQPKDKATIRITYSLGHCNTKTVCITVEIPVDDEYHVHPRYAEAVAIDWGDLHKDERLRSTITTRSADTWADIEAIANQVISDISGKLLESSKKYEELLSGIPPQRNIFIA